MKITKAMLLAWTPEQFWEAYKQAVYGGSLSSDQEKECSNALYAGMHAAWEFQIQVACQLSESQAVKTLKRFDNQLKNAALSQNPTGDN